ncbi:MAG: CHAT domain-containing protein [Acidobacteria bacterium]|nr:CHAT domain-containing protein [Acidobacteriota bacterium]
MAEAPIVFFSYSSADRAVVQELAAKVEAAGFRVWVDRYEIRGGDDFVDKLNEGLAACAAGLLFVSRAALDSPWAQREWSFLTKAQVEKRKRVIPVLLERVPVPALLDTLHRCPIDDVDGILDAIRERANRPQPDAAVSRARTRRLAIRLEPLPDRRVRVTATLDGASWGAAHEVELGSGFRYSLESFLRQRFALARDAAAQARAERDRALAQIGDQVGRVLFPQDLAQAVVGLLEQTRQAGERVELAVETADSELLAAPWETARLANGLTPALLDIVTLLRRDLDAQGTAEPLPGPLKILVAVGAPDEGNTRGAPLDLERELQTIFDAIDAAKQAGGAYVRVLEVGGVESIQAALTDQAYHVLHLSGHGGRMEKDGKSFLGIELEDEDGQAVPTSAEEIAHAIRESGRPAPLVFLASCHSGRGERKGESALTGLAEGLLDAGVARVLAMQAAVSDDYATRLAGAFYRQLTLGEKPLASHALAVARREVETAFRREERPDAVSEFATPSLFVAGEEAPLLDRGLPLEAFRGLPEATSRGAVPRLKAGDLVGRREEVRRTVRTLELAGGMAGVQLLGMGGVGKSSVAGRVIDRLAERYWTVVTLSGRWALGDLCLEIALALADHPDQGTRALGQALNSPEVEDRRKPLLIAKLLRETKLLLVLDNFEDLLTEPGGEAYRQAETAELMDLLYHGAGKGRLLVTCRYPVPGSAGKLAKEPLGPLPPSQVRKLRLRLPGFEGLKPEDAALLLRAVGGHPRMLEYLDGVLRGGEGRLEHVTERLKGAAEELGLNLTEKLEPKAALARALELGAADILLDELLELARRTPGDEEALRQLAVFPRPVTVATVATSLGGGTEAAGEAETAAAGAALDRLGRLSLATGGGDGRWWVHRWTALAIEQRAGEADWREVCRRGGEALWLPTPHDLGDSVEAARLLLSARDWDRAGAVWLNVGGYLEQTGRMLDFAGFAAEVAVRFPDHHPEYARSMAVAAHGLWLLGRTDEALARFDQSRAAWQRLTELQPGMADYQRGLSVSFERMGDLLMALGRGEEAGPNHEQALGIRKRLAEGEPGRVDYQGDLSVTFKKMGDLLMALGKEGEAREYYEQALEIAKRLAEAEPERADYQRDLSVSFNKMGDLLEALGRAEEAREYYEQDLEIAKRLAEGEPGRADYQRGLAVSYERMGALARNAKDFEGFLESYGRALAIREALAQQESGRADLAVELAVCLANIPHPELLERALGILVGLRDEGRLAPIDEPKIAAAEGLLQEMRAARGA